MFSKFPSFVVEAKSFSKLSGSVFKQADLVNFFQSIDDNQVIPS